jgi:hypothetical protein
MHSVVRTSLLAIVLAALCVSLTAERVQLPPSQRPVLPVQKPQPVVGTSGFIFSGTVKTVERSALRQGLATTEITFYVDEAIRGVKSGQIFAIREWAGLWEAGEHYQPGERVLLFLYPLSKLGLTSPVRGPSGRYKVSGDGTVVPGPSGSPLRRNQQVGSGGETRLKVRDFVRALQIAERSRP